MQPVLLMAAAALVCLRRSMLLQWSVLGDRGTQEHGDEHRREDATSGKIGRRVM